MIRTFVNGQLGIASAIIDGIYKVLWYGNGNEWVIVSDKCPDRSVSQVTYVCRYDGWILIISRNRRNGGKMIGELQSKFPGGASA